MIGQKLLSVFYILSQKAKVVLDLRPRDPKSIPPLIMNNLQKSCEVWKRSNENCGRYRAHKPKRDGQTDARTYSLTHPTTHERPHQIYPIQHCWEGIRRSSGGIFTAAVTLLVCGLRALGVTATCTQKSSKQQIPSTTSLLMMHLYNVTPDQVMNVPLLHLSESAVHVTHLPLSLHLSL